MRATATALVGLWCVLRCAAWAADQAEACVAEVGRLSERFPVNGEGEQARPIAGAAGARKDAALSDEQRQAIGSEIRAARAAGERGDGAGCLGHLGRARAGLRQAGVGGALPGMAGTDAAMGAPGGGSGTSSGTPGAGPDVLTGPGGSTGAGGRTGSLAGDGTGTATGGTSGGGGGL